MFKKLNAAKKQVKGDNFERDIKFIIKSLKLFTAGNDNHLLDGTITIPEIKRAGKKLKNNKACGQDMIRNEMIECIIETRFIEIILCVFNLILDKSQLPEIIGKLLWQFLRERIHLIQIIIGELQLQVV